MINTLFTSAAILAMTTAVHGMGKAVVVNQCSETVNMDNVPASGGGASEISQQIPSGGSYSQTWTPLTNGQGWSMKLSPNAGSASVVQYEYTKHTTDDLIWYDVSAVNGDPFDGDWYISSTAGCNPRQAAYRYPTDDTFGMQDACPDSSTITVTLCSGAGGAAPADPAPSAPVASVLAPAPSEAAPPAGGADRPDRQPDPQVPDVSVPAPSIPEVSAPALDHNGRHHFNAPPGVKIEEGGFDDVPTQTITNVQTMVVTQFVTVSPSPVKRSEHLRRHAHHHDHF